MKSLLCRLCREQNGQALYLVAASMIVILGMAALSIDIGFALHAQRELQANTDAAASAGGASIPNPATTSVATVVDNYSGETGALYNVHPDLYVTNVSVSFACLPSSTYPNYNLPPCTASSNGSYPNCETSTGSSTGCNVIKVVETATEPTFFAKIFGIKQLTLTATSIASASGNAIPYHIMLVLDTTASMASGSDPGCISLASLSANTYTPEQCAQMGAQQLLTGLAPCLQGQTCNSSSTPVTPVDQVGVMVFPGLCSDTAAGITTQNCPTLPSTAALTDTTANSTYAPRDVACSSRPPTIPITPYNNNPEYLLLGFQDNYQVTDGAGLNTAASLVDSVGAGTWISNGATNDCGLSAPGGEGTFYAGAIVAAQTYLTSYHTTNIQDIMILLSDGDATASSAQMGGSVSQNQGTDPVSSSQIPAMNGNLFSATSECTQAVQAADWAKNYKQSDGKATLIYSVSYGSETSGCASEVRGSAYNTPCLTMEGIASTPLNEYFFSVPMTTIVKGVSTPGTVCSGAVPITKLDQVFQAISADLESSRLIPGSLNASATWTTAP
jgi:Flp pilus assembly protein TadG